MAQTQGLAVGEHSPTHSTRFQPSAYSGQFRIWTRRPPSLLSELLQTVSLSLQRHGKGLAIGPLHHPSEKGQEVPSPLTSRCSTVPYVVACSSEMRSSPGQHGAYCIGSLALTILTEVCGALLSSTIIEKTVLRHGWVEPSATRPTPEPLFTSMGFVHPISSMP